MAGYAADDPRQIVRVAESAISRDVFNRLVCVLKEREGILDFKPFEIFARRYSHRGGESSGKGCPANMERGHHGFDVCFRLIPLQVHEIKRRGYKVVGLSGVIFGGAGQDGKSDLNHFLRMALKSRIKREGVMPKALWKIFEKYKAS